jgi:30S ribosomal protein S31
MGKGDKKSRRGKIWIGSYGVRRPARNKKPAFVVVPKAEKPVKTPKKAEVKTEEVLIAAEVQETAVVETVQEEKKAKKVKKTEGETEKKKKAPKAETAEGEEEKPKAKKAPAKKAKEETEQTDLFSDKKE